MADRSPKPPAALSSPHIRLYGDVEPYMLQRFLDQLAKAGDADPLVVEMTTQGGDAEIGRRLALELRVLRSRGRELLFLGKTTVYSAGVTMMAAVPASHRWITDDAVLLLHARKIIRTVELDGDLRDAEEFAHRLLAEIEVSLEVQRQGFLELIEGSKLTVDDMKARARSDWYLTAAEALELGLVAGIWGPRVGKT